MLFIFKLYNFETISNLLFKYLRKYFTTVKIELMKSRKFGSNATAHISLYLIALVATMAGCNKDYINVMESKPTPIEFVAYNDDGVQTRVTGSKWDEGDQIGLFAIKNNQALKSENIFDGNDNVIYETNGSGHFYTKDKYMYYPSDGSEIDIVGYYPHSNLIVDYKYPIDIKQQKDVLWSNNLKGISKTNNKNNDLHFKRTLSKVVLNVGVKQQGESLEGMRVSVIGANTAGSLNLATGEVSVDNDSKQDFDVILSGTATQKEVVALLLPTNLEEVIKIKFTFANNKTYTWQLPHALASGKVYSYNIKLDNTGVEISKGGYMEIPHYALADQVPHSFKAMHMVGNKGWLNPSFTYGNNPIRNYTVLFDTENRVPYWIAFPMHAMYLASGNRTDDWAFDPIVPQEYQPSLFSSWTTKDLDRGHLLASADRSATREINRTTFYFTNMAPQNNKMNSGTWSTLENKVRAWTTQTDYDTLYVVTGTILAKPPAQVIYTTDDNGKKSVVPTHLYKALLRKHKATGKYVSIAFKMANDASGVGYSQSAVSVAELEAETGFTFFNALPASDASSIKQNKSISPHWN